MNKNSCRSRPATTKPPRRTDERKSSLAIARASHNASFADAARLMREAVMERMVNALYGAEPLAPKELLALAKAAEVAQRVGSLSLNMGRTRYVSPFESESDAFGEEMARLLMGAG